MSAGTSTRGPITAAKAAPELYSEDCDRNRNGQLEIVARGGEGQASRLRIVRAEPCPIQNETKKHHDEIDQKRNGDPKHVQWQPDDVVAFQREHHDDREEQRYQRERADARDELLFVPLPSLARRRTSRVSIPARKGIPR